MSKGLPSVTIAIPTYNRADSYLRQAIDSALNQTYPNIEIIVSDNCSSDNTEMLMKGFKDKRIRYVRHKKNIGANNNFNFCLKEAKGDYFLLLQDDDLIDHDFIEVCIKAANYDTNIGIIRTGTRLIDDKGAIIAEYFNKVGGLNTIEFFRGWFAYRTTLYLCSTLFNTVRLTEIGGFRSKHNLFQDVIAEVQLAAKFGRVDIMDIKASYRKHPNEMTFAVKVSQWCEDSLMLLDLMCELESESREVIKKEGMRFFAMLNYKRAGAVKSPLKRFIAYLTVLKKFDFRYLPSKNHFLTSVYQLLYRTPIYFGLRFLKRKMEKVVKAFVPKKYHCPCCSGKFNKFLPFGVMPRANALCPGCGTIERHRLLWLYLKNRTNFFYENLKVLHFAPEPFLQKTFVSMPNLDYISADLNSHSAMVKMDITNIFYEDNSFDVILCYHVLEHIQDDQQAISELFRILKPGGWAILQVPLDLKRDKTYEDPNIVTPEDRESSFGQKDHLRIYGKDYKDRLEKVGFTVNVDSYVRGLGNDTIRKYGLIEDEDIYFCVKANFQKD